MKAIYWIIIGVFVFALCIYAAYCIYRIPEEMMNAHKTIIKAYEEIIKFYEKLGKIRKIIDKIGKK